MEDKTPQNGGTLLKRVLMRFARGFIAGFLPILLVGLQNGEPLVIISGAAFYGGIVGALMAVDKWFREKYPWYVQK